MKTCGNILGLPWPVVRHETAWKVTFDNTGILTVFAKTAQEAMKKAEEHAQSFGWNMGSVLI